MTMKMPGSRIIVESLLKQGVDTVFGYPGGAIMPLYDALHDAPLRHVLTVHEQGAAHAADGYARSSGRTGVCLATSGPGATNLVTGLATAFMDSSPVVAITGQVPTTLLGRDSFQEMDITGISMPITKHSFLVRNVTHLADSIQKAFAIAGNGRPGPVLIDIPRDVMTDMADYCPECLQDHAVYSQVHTPSTQAIHAAVGVLASAERPVLMVGGGVKASGAADKVVRFAQMSGIPVVSTLMGLGVFPPDYPYFLGLTGMHGQTAANLAVYEADVVFAVGTRFSERVTGDPSSYSIDKTVIHVDVDPAEFDKNVAADITLAGNLGHLLLQIANLLSQRTCTDLSAWQKRIKEWRKIRVENTSESLTPAWMMRCMSELTTGFPVTWVTDVGQHQMWAAQHLQIHQPRSWVTSGGMGTMGFGLPAAIGAQLACPDRRAILIAGDGGFKMTGMELYTAVNEKLPIICIIVQNQSLGMVRQWQTLFFKQRYAYTSLPPFDFAGFARTCGADACVTTTPDEFRTAFSNALSKDMPTLIVVDIAPGLLVKPMVSPGQPINQFIE